MKDIVWWEVETDLPALFQQFHGKLWGWTFVPAFAGTELQADYWVIQHEGADVGGLQRAASEVLSAGVRVYLSVDDLEATLERAVSMGGASERERVALDGGQWFALFRDPAGVQFGLWTAQPRAEAG